VGAGVLTRLAAVVRRGHDRAVAAVREVLGDETFQTLWARGQELSAEAAVAYALADAELA
jgi:hypothetical protein